MRFMKRLNPIFLSCAALLLLAGCSGTKETLGLTREAPDEFAVVKRAPLELPPDYTLRPPEPGAPRPQEQATDQQARQAVFGLEEVRPQNTARGEDSILLQKAGADAVDPNIRSAVDRETRVMAEQDRPAVKKLLNIGKDDVEPPATLVDAEAEAERLRKNQEEGKPLSEGETPTIEEE